MLNKIGRLDSEDKKELTIILHQIIDLIEKKKETDAKKLLKKLGMTQNYFIREFAGLELAEIDEQRQLYPILKEFLDHKFYGARAIALFYLCKVHENDVEEVFSILEHTFETTPWEVETIITNLWKDDPEFMKSNMLEWIKSDNPKRRALSFHGMEYISNSDPTYIMDFISEAIDDDTMEVQKKITHILTQIARDNPIVVYPYVRKWLKDADDKRIKTIWVSMKKLANIVNQRARRDESEQFVLLTEQTIDDWVHDSNEKVVTMGEKLRYILSRRYNGNNSNNSNNNNHSNNRTNNKPRNSRNPRNNRRDKRY
ncbi:MAG: DNA alkylation repair protein [Candidatus Cloacimonadales bacterium]